MKFNEVMELYKNFLEDPPYAEGDKILEVVVLLPKEELDPKTNTFPIITHFVNKLPMITYENGKICCPDDFMITDFIKDTWEICKYRDLSMSSHSKKVHSYQVKTIGVINYLKGRATRFSELK